jgi:hypothetical protein
MCLPRSELHLKIAKDPLGFGGLKYRAVEGHTDIDRLGQ